LAPKVAPKPGMKKMKKMKKKSVRCNLAPKVAPKPGMKKMKKMKKKVWGATWPLKLHLNLVW